MQIFTSTLQQMALLFTFIAIGYIVAKLKVVPDNAGAVLSKLENNVFTPASILGTFMTGFTVAKLSSAWQFVTVCIAVVAISIPLAMLIAKFTSKDSYVRKIYTYGLAFSNFGFMGNAVVQSVYGDEIYMNYLIFVIPLWVAIYGWGVPALLMPSAEGHGIKARLKNIFNPMLIATFIGMIIGITALPVPAFITGAVKTLGGCMSPIAMLLTGMAIAKINLKESFTDLSIYVISVARLIVIPFLFMIPLYFIPMPFEVKLCAVCAVSMPLGLSTIVVPGAYGLDTKKASGMALISHLLSCITIPIVFMLFDMIFKSV